MGATLASRENSLVNALLKIRCFLEVFPKKDEPSTGTTKSLMTVKIVLNDPQSTSKQKKKKHTWW